MDPDDFKQAWTTQSSRTRLSIDAELLIKEVRRNDRNFAAMIFWRDFREVGTGLLMIPLWVYLGARSALPWTWYLMVPAMLWIVAFMLVDRMRQNSKPPEPGEPLRQCVESSLAQVDHQIWLLRNVGWWYLLPFALSALPFVGQGAWQERAGGWWTFLAFSIVVALFGVVLAGIFWLNQYAVNAELGPRRQELEALLLSLEDESAAANS